MSVIVARVTVGLSATGWAILLVGWGLAFARRHTGGFDWQSALFDASILIITTAVGLRNSGWVKAGS